MIRPFDNGGNFHKEIWRASMGIYLKIRGSSETQNEVLKFLCRNSQLLLGHGRRYPELPSRYYSVQIPWSLPITRKIRVLTLLRFIFWKSI